MLSLALFQLTAGATDYVIETGRRRAHPQIKPGDEHHEDSSDDQRHDHHREPERQRSGQGLCRPTSTNADPRGLRCYREDRLPATEAVHGRRPRRLRSLDRGHTYYAPWGNLAIFHKDFG